ncbi:MAG: bifunctional metallophosphatase/5'-nucleotidase [Acidobacteriota bacterium]
MIHRLLLPFALLSIPLALAAQRPRPDSPAVAIELLAFNDFHGNLEPPTGANGRVGRTVAGGAEYLATHLKRAVERQPNSIIVAAGDLVGAAPLISGLFHDEPAIESLNAIGLSLSAVGNHEFDRGSRELQRRQRGGCHPVDGCRDGQPFPGARFQYLAANVIDTATRRPVLPATAVRTIGGVRVGFIGETLKGTPQIVAPSGTAGLTFLDEAATANRYARQLRQQGVRALVLLIHEGGQQSVPDEAVDPNGCVDFTGPIAAIARKLTPDIKVIISAHSHRVYNCSIAGHLVTSAASFGRAITRVSLTIDRTTGAVTRAAAVNEIVTRDVPKDPVQTALVEKYAALAAPIARRTAGSVTASITRETNRAGESALGDVVTDAHLAAARTAGGNAAVAFMNNSGIRADLVAGSATVAAPAPVTYGELYDAQPFGNTLITLTVTGDMIKRLLEQQFTQPDTGADVLQVSAGFSYRYKLTAPAGQHVDPDSISLDGRKIAAADRVRIIVNDFLVNGGLGFTVLKEGTGRSGGALDIDAFAGYFKDHSPVAPGRQDRIVRTD